MATPIVSVVTAVRNGAGYLDETIASIRSQTFTDWEFLIVDDASTDETPDIIRAASERDGRLRVIRRSESGGPYIAANEGLSLAAGSYIARIDADDVATPERLEHQLRLLESEPSLQGCASYWRVIDSDGVLTAPINRPPGRTSRVLAWALCTVSGIVHSTAFVRRSVFERSGAYAPWPVSADFELWCRLARNGWLGVLPEVGVHWRRHGGQISASRYDQQRQRTLDVVGDHIEQMSGERLGRDVLDDVWAVGHWEPVDLCRATRSLDIWETLWRDDESLTPPERRELGRLTRRLRLRALRFASARTNRSVVTGVRRMVRVPRSRQR